MKHVRPRPVSAVSTPAPSASRRASVNPHGDAAVAHHGGVAEFAARESDCVDLDGDGAPDNSTGTFDAKLAALWHHLKTVPARAPGGRRPT